MTIPKPNARVLHVTCTTQVTVSGKGALPRNIFDGGAHQGGCIGIKMQLHASGIFCTWEKLAFIIPWQRVDSAMIDPADLVDEDSEKARSKGAR